MKTGAVRKISSYDRNRPRKLLISVMGQFHFMKFVGHKVKFVGHKMRIARTILYEPSGSKNSMISVGFARVSKNRP